MKNSKSHFRGLTGLALLCCFVGIAARSNAQQDTPKPVQDPASKPAQAGRISGADISIAGGPSTAAASLPVKSGNVVTVHSGQAHLNLEGGGDLGVCGPAKFQLLQSGDAITLALQFGRIHVRLSGSSPLVIYTPFFQATPSALPEGQRDATIGLETNGTFCARADQGGLQIQQQLTGESLIVPQPQEVFFVGGETKPVHNLSGCTCVLKSAATFPPPAAPPPSSAPAAPAAPAAPQHTPASPLPSSGNTATPERNDAPMAGAASQSISSARSTPAPADGPAESQAAPPPPASPPEVRVVMPPLSFSANSPQGALTPTPGQLLLVRGVRVQPEYVFTGHVAAAQSRSESKSSVSSPVVKPQGEKPGFWTRLKRVFGS